MSLKVAAWVASVCVVVGPALAVGARSDNRRSSRYLGNAFMVDTGVTLMPLPGSQFSYAAASNGSGWRVMWGYDYAVYTNGINSDGLLLETRGGLVGHDSYMMGGLSRSIVGTGSGFTAVWTSTSSPPAIWASRLDSAGALLDSAVIFEDSSDQAFPAVEFDGDSTCLAVWTVSRASDRDVYAARLTAGGRVIDTTPFAIAHDPLRREAYPSVAYGQGIYLVAWTVYDSGWAQPKAKAITVSADGVVLDTAIFLRRDPAATQERPSVAFGGTCFLAAWSERTVRPDIFAARVSLSGELIDTAGAQLSYSPLRDRFPAVGFDGTQFLVMWQEGDTIATSTGTVCGRRVTAAGTPLDSGLIRPTPVHHSCTYPSIAADRSSFLVAFCDLDSITHDDNVGCVRIGPDGAVLDSVIVLPLGANLQGVPSGASDGTDFLAAWTETGELGEVVQAARIAADGTLLDPIGLTVNGAPGGKSSATAAFGDSLYLVAWADNRGANGYDIYCARVRPDGCVLDTSGMVVCDAALGQDFPAISSDGRDFLVTWHDLRSGADGDIYAARVSRDGVVLDPGGFAVGAETLDAAAPAVCFAGDDYLVVWMEGPFWQGRSNIYGALVSPAGVVSKPRFVVCEATGDQVNPVAAGGGTSSLVAWEDSRMPTTAPDIYGARVSADGTLLDSIGFTIVATGRPEMGPRVVSDEDGFRVLWNNWTPADGIVFSTGRVDTTGSVSHVADWFAVTSGPSFGYDAAYGNGPELLLLFTVVTDTALGRYWGNYRLWGKLGAVPGVEEVPNAKLGAAEFGATVVRGALFLPGRAGSSPATSCLLDISGRKVLDLKPGANDVRALAPGVYFMREAQAQAQAQAVQKVIITR